MSNDLILGLIFGSIATLIIASLCRRICDWRARPVVSEYDWENA